MQSPIIKTGIMGTATTLIAVGVTLVINDPELLGGYFLTGLGVLGMLVKYINTNGDSGSEE